MTNAAKLRPDAPAVSLVIPTLNEVHGLSDVLGAIPALVQQVIVVDGGSSDGTPELVERLRPDALVLMQTEKGKGGALKLGIAAASKPIVVTMDADGSMDPADVVIAVEALLAGAQFVKGSRLLPGGGSSDFTLWRRIGNRFLTTLTNRLFKSAWSDITYGFNAYWRESIDRFDTLSDGFGFEVQAAVRAQRDGFRTAEVACYEAPRAGGMSKLSPIRDGFQILCILLRERFGSTPSCFRTVHAELKPIN